MQVALFIVAGFVALWLLGWRAEPKPPTTFGSARWSSVWTLFKKGLLKRKGLLVGDWTGRLGVYFDGPHALTFGVTGARKGVSAILPNLLTQPYIFLVDPGGENTAVAVKSWRDRSLARGASTLSGCSPMRRGRCRRTGSIRSTCSTRTARASRPTRWCSPKC
ncbi:MAG: type IV secretory system conjugative DNA transfer family protein [Rhodospirillaceae bacterium]|nr:type IV secretory system conjugative DNA transfer family protein [Rhodospirillaceae bacterium]